MKSLCMPTRRYASCCVTPCIRKYACEEGGGGGGKALCRYFSLFPRTRRISISCARGMRETRPRLLPSSRIKSRACDPSPPSSPLPGEERNTFASLVADHRVIVVETFSRKFFFFCFFFYSRNVDDERKRWMWIGTRVNWGEWWNFSGGWKLGWWPIITH